MSKKVKLLPKCSGCNARGCTNGCSEDNQDVEEIFCDDCGFEIENGFDVRNTEDGVVCLDCYDEYLDREDDSELEDLGDENEEE